MKRTTKGILLLGLQSLRKEFGYHRKDVAESIGINYTTLWRLEVGRTGATYQTAKDLAEFFGTTIDRLEKNMQECVK